MWSVRERLWRRLVALWAWLQRRVRRRRPPLLAPPEGFDDRAGALDPELLRSLEKVGDSPVVRDAVATAIAHFCDLREVIDGPGARELVADLDLLAEAEALLREIVGRAPDVSAVVVIARGRRDDRPGREAAGAALLSLRDQVRLLGDVASAALAWGASREASERIKLEECAARLRRP